VEREPLGMKMFIGLKAFLGPLNVVFYGPREKGKIMIYGHKPEIASSFSKFCIQTLTKKI
jgi:hypothetical protein